MGVYPTRLSAAPAEEAVTLLTAMCGFSATISKTVLAIYRI